MEYVHFQQKKQEKARFEDLPRAVAVPVAGHIWKLEGHHCALCQDPALAENVEQSIFGHIGQKMALYYNLLEVCVCVCVCVCVRARDVFRLRSSSEDW